MEMRRLGQSDLHVSAVGLGCNNFGMRIDQAQTDRVVAQALDRGINLFDTADIYGGQGGSERMLGKALGSQRGEVVLASKFGMPMDSSGERQGASRAYILQAVEDSLQRLGTDWIDLYQIHQSDPKTPLEETMRALEDLVQSGKVRYVGCSNLSAQEIDTARAVLPAGSLGFVSGQYEYSLLERSIEGTVIPRLKAQGMGLLPYFPLASGLLSGKYRRREQVEGRLTTMKSLGDRYMTEANWDKVERLTALAETRGASLLQLAFGWLLAHPAVSSVIAGATQPEQIDQNVSAGDWRPDEALMAAIDEAVA